MSIYTTPLQFGYFLALAMAVLLWLRGFKEERLSDKLLGWVLFFLAMEIQDYTFGFAGINFLWEELNGFPRGTSLLFGPAVYYYLRAQTNRNFKFSKKHLLDLLPWFIPFLVRLFIFFQGKYTVQNWQDSDWNQYLSYPMRLLHWGSYVFYFGKSLKLYKGYREWSKNQFSDQELISFKWFRNLIYAMILGIVFKETMSILDDFFEWDFYQDWWWNLGIVAIIFYVGIWGYAQVQPAFLDFSMHLSNEKIASEKDIYFEELKTLKPEIERLMTEQRIYLQPTLNLKFMAQKLRINPSLLSAAINHNFDKNFNDFVNEYRVNEFTELSQKPEFKHFTLLALALESGFNSKSTFNRAFKKAKGVAPSKQII